MYLSLRDPSRAPGSPPAGARRTRVAPTVVALGVVSMLTDISSESVAAILPLYLISVLGVSTLAYGFVDGLYQGVSSLVRIAAGWASDRGDHPKWVALAGYGLSAAARVGLLGAGGVTAVAATVTADRIGKGIRTAPRDAMIAASSDPQHLGRAYGVHRTLDTVGAALGPFVAFGILWLVPEGYDVVMVTSLGFAVLGIAVLVLLVPDVRPRRHAPAAVAARAPAAAAAVAPGSRPGRPWRQALTPELVRLMVVGGGLALLTVGDGFLYLALIDRSEFATYWFPLLYVGTNVAYLLLALPLGRLADRHGRARVWVLGHVALLAAYLAAAVPLSGVAPTLVTLVLLGAFYAATDGVLAALAATAVPVEVRASGIAAAQTVVALGRLLASGLFGLLWFTTSATTALVTVACVLAALVPASLVAVRRLQDSR